LVTEFRDTQRRHFYLTMGVVTIMVVVPKKKTNNAVDPKAKDVVEGTYEISQAMETKCFQQKYVYPGFPVWEKVMVCIAKFIRQRKHIYNGGWGIHYFLKSIDPELIIYDESDLCDASDFDLFGPSPATDLYDLGRLLRRQVPDLNFTIGSGMHPNQYTISVNFMGSKLVDWIYLSPKLFAFLPSATYANGVVGLHPIVELMRHFFLLSNIFLLPPDKDLQKVVKRVRLLETHAFAPWLKDKKLWTPSDLAGARATVVDMPYPLEGKAAVACVFQKGLRTEWVPSFDHACIVGQLAYLEHDSQAVPKTDRFVSMHVAVHDASFVKCMTSVASHLRAACAKAGIDPAHVKFVGRNAFMGVVGPLYNGWVECQYLDTTFLGVYSLASPVHVSNRKTKCCSYFFNMAHMLWWTLYLAFNKRSVEAMLFTQMVGLTYGGYRMRPKDDLYTVHVDRAHAIGVLPVRNFYMMNNMMRAQNMAFKYTLDKKTDPSPRKAGNASNASAGENKVKAFGEYDYGYKDYEGQVIFTRKLSDTPRGWDDAPPLPYLYGRIPKKTQ
jgi:hypothetical protein